MSSAKGALSPISSRRERSSCKNRQTREAPVHRRKRPPHLHTPAPSRQQKSHRGRSRAFSKRGSSPNKIFQLWARRCCSTTQKPTEIRDIPRAAINRLVTQFSAAAGTKASAHDVSEARV